MKIVIEKATKRAVIMFADDDAVTLSETGLEAPGLLISDVLADSHEIVSGSAPELPLYWVAGALSFDGAWTVQDETAYGELVSAAQAAQQKVAAEKQAAAIAECQRQRAAEYPPMADYIDGIVKGDQSQVQAYIDACLAVKAKYPKPE
jgi:hypothetical protein